MTASEEALEVFLGRSDPVAAPLIRTLDGIVHQVRPSIDSRISYGMLMYAVDGDLRHWPIAIDARPRKVSLRFHYGVRMSDPLHVLRGGSSVLSTWDFLPTAAIDTAAVAAYVGETLDQYPQNLATADEILAELHAARRAPRRRGGGGRTSRPTSR